MTVGCDDVHHGPSCQRGDPARRTDVAPRRGLPVLVAALLATAGCFGGELAPTIWPPPDFACEIEEVALRDAVPQVVRRFAVQVDGTVVYGTAERSRIDAVSGAALPVFDRLVVYRLVPECVRAFARRLDRLGIGSLETVQGERGVASDAGLVLRWRAFGDQRTIVARGRVFGAMAEILDLITAHLPDGERFGLPGFAERPIVAVLRGIPPPQRDAKEALVAHRTLLTKGAPERRVLLDSFALACAVGDRAAAEELLQQWSVATAELAKNPFADDGKDGITPEVLQRLLPLQ